MNNQASSIGALIERIARLLTTESHTGGLLPVHWETLHYLRDANRYSRTLAGVTAYLGLTKGTVSQTLKTLEGKGLVSKITNPGDKRSKRLALTKPGEQILKQDPLTDLCAAIDELPEDMGERLEAGLRQLLTNRLNAQQRAVFGQCRNCIYFERNSAQGSPHRCALLEVSLTAKDSGKICSEQRPVTSLS